MTVSKSFKNEFGNDIEIRIAETRHKKMFEIIVSMAGPNSINENTITLMEAKKLQEALNEYFNDERI